MDKKLLFNEALTSLVDFAAANANHVTMDDVKLYFKDLIDDDSQYQFIYDYLALNKVEIEGFTPPANNPLADGKWSQLSLMETGESCRLLLRRNRSSEERLSTVRSSAAAVHGAGESAALSGSRESNIASAAKSSETMVRQIANTKGRWQRTALMQPNRPATVPLSSNVHIKPA